MKSSLLPNWWCDKNAKILYSCGMPFSGSGVADFPEAHSNGVGPKSAFLKDLFI